MRKNLFVKLIKDIRDTKLHLDFSLFHTQTHIKIIEI